MNLPNAITVFRIFLIPALVAILLIRFENREVYGVAVYLLAALTDWLDGFLARRWRQVTVTGKLLDPVADKMLTSAVLITLVQLGGVSAWMVVVLIAREFAVTGLRMIAASQRLVIPAHFLGKAKTFAEAPTLVVLILGETWLGPVGPIAGKAGLWIVLLLSLSSGADYLQKFWKRIDFEASAEESP